MPKSVNNGGVTYEFGGGTAAFLYLTDNAGTSKASQAFWSVEDVDREIAELKKRGIVFERYNDMPGERSSEGAVIAGGAKAAWFKDSEGNILAIVQSLRSDAATRVIGASPDTIYQAFANAASLMQWFPPSDMSGQALEYDFREGGRYRIELPRR